MNNLCIVKWDPARVALDMEMLTSNGNYVFESDECLTQRQIKRYFSRLALKQRSMQQVSDQQTTAMPTVSSSSSTTVSSTNDFKSPNTAATDESSENEEIDGRELEIYSWRHVLDEAKDILHNSSTKSASPSSSPITKVSPKRKSTLNAQKKFTNQLQSNFTNTYRTIIVSFISQHF